MYVTQNDYNTLILDFKNNNNKVDKKVIMEETHKVSMEEETHCGSPWKM
jgi:hypothetical protein